MMAKWDRYWFRDASLRDLALARIVIIGFQLVWMATCGLDLRLVAHSLAADPAEAPLLVLRLLSWPIGGPDALDLERVRMIVWVAYVAGVLALIGLGTRLTLGVFAWSQCVILGWLYSGGRLHHPEAMLTVALVALACAPSGAALALDSLRRGPRSETSPWAGWPLLLVRWLLALAYLSAASSKLFTCGLDWVNGSTLQYFTFIKGMALDQEVGIWLSQHHLTARALSILTLGFESTFFVVLLRPGLARIWVPVGAAIHTGVFVSIGAPFFQFVALYAVFIPVLRRGQSSSEYEDSSADSPAAAGAPIPRRG